MFHFSYKRNLRMNAPVKLVEAPVRTFIPTHGTLPPGSLGPTGGGGPLGAPSLAGSDGRVLYDWQESTIPIDAQSYRSLPISRKLIDI